MSESFGSMLEVARIQSEINRLFENLLHLDNEQSGGAQWTPNADIVDTGSHLIVEVELPGVSAEGLSVTVNSGNITIRGNKPQPDHTAALREPRQERRYGTFHRTMQLGLPVNTRQATAELRHGLLKIHFPKVPNRRGEDVTIKVVTV
jgi:HSP20 family protein